MARTQGSTDLFRLVHSLNKNEKTYFRKFATRHINDGSQYLKLFDAVDAQKEFEEASLKKNFKAYPVMKNYLFNMILKGLLQHEENFVGRERQMLQIIHSEVLMTKGLPDKALQILEKGLEEARQDQTFMMEEEFLRRIFFAKQQLWTVEDYRGNPFRIFDELRAASDKQRNEDRYWREGFKIQVGEKRKMYGITHKEKDEIDIQFLEDESAAISSKARQLRFINLCAYYLAIKDYKKGYAITSQFLKSEKHLIAIGNPYGRYRPAVKNHVLACINVLRLKEAMDILDKDWKFRYYGKDATRTDTMHFLHFKFNIYWLMGEHLKGQQYAAQQLALLNDPDYIKQFPYIVPESLKVALLFEFSNGDYQKAAMSIHDFQSRIPKKVNLTYFKDCELLKILLQVEMGNFEVMRRSIHNILRRPKQLALSEKEIKFLEILRGLNASNTKQIYAQLARLFPAYDESQDILTTLYISTWVMSKQQNISLAQAVKAHSAHCAKKYK